MILPQSRKGDIMIVEFLVNNQPIVIFTILFISAIFIVLWKLSDNDNGSDVNPAEIDYDRLTLKEIVEPDLRKELDSKKADKVGATLYENKQKRGYVLKEITKVEAKEDIKMKFRQKGNESEDTEDTERVRVFLMVDSGGKVSRFRDKISLSNLLGSDGEGRIEVISEHLIEHEDPDKIIMNEADWSYSAGCWFTKTPSAQNVKKRKVIETTTDQLLEELPNFSRKVSNVNPFNTMALMREEAKSDDDSDITINKG